jgi:DHA2 family multidrug resistance protein
MSDAKSVNRLAVSLCMMSGVFMQALDTTIANVALPYMQGSVSASQDEIAWVLTSYIVAAAIMTPPTGFLASRFGVKRVFLFSVGGFTIVSMLCGAAQTLPEIVVFRVLQGIFGAPLVPLAQTVMFNIATRDGQGRSMASFGMAVMVAPIVGPVLGGWLTSNFSWRYIFYVNLPMGVAAFIGTLIFVHDEGGNRKVKLDWFGFAALSIAVGCMQVVLDRGEELDWFSSKEILWETVAGATALYLFIAHTLTTQRSFARPTIFKDVNLAAGTAFIFVIGLTYYSSLALQPPFLEQLMNYPSVAAGWVMGPRGLGTMLGMLIVGRLTNRVNVRYLLGGGLLLVASSFYFMTGWTPDISNSMIATTGFAQGLGLGFIFVPLSATALSTLSPAERPEGAGMYSLARNLGSSMGISVVTALLAHNTQENHAIISAAATPFNRTLHQPDVSRFWNLFTPGGVAALDAEITRQAQIIAYTNDYKMLMIATFCAVPLIVIFKQKKRQV